MLDRIDSMTHDECREVLRNVLRATDANFYSDLHEILKPCRPTPLDRLREFLKQEGWVQNKDWNWSHFKMVRIQHGNQCLPPEQYHHPDWK